MSQKACAAHERPELAVNVIGSAVGVSVNTVGRPTKLDAVAAEFMPDSAHQHTNISWCAEHLAGMTVVRVGHSASQGAVDVGNGLGNGAPDGGGDF